MQFAQRSDVVAAPRPSLPVMLWRGVRRRCPWCAGRGAFFDGWFSKRDRCRACGLGWHRGYEGFELGAMATNVIMSFGLLLMALAVGIVATLPDVPVVGLVVVLGAGAIVLPIVFYPLSYTLWQAVDLTMHTPAADDPATPPYR